MTQPTPRDVVTGAFSYTGRFVARRLLNAGREVRTLTHHPHRPQPFGSKVIAFAYNFENPSLLVDTLRGTDTLYCTYWVRYPYGQLTFEKAIGNSKTLFQAAQKAGVRRIVHVSIAHPSKSSPLAYYSGKAIVEEALRETGLSYAIFRPTVLFGQDDILINNIAWMVRHFPVFAVPGDGRYRLQPIHVEDFAQALVEAGPRHDNEIHDAVGPESYSFRELVALIAKEIGKTTRCVSISPTLTYWITSLMGRFLGDVILTREEIQGLMDNLLVSNERPFGQTRLSDWIRKNRHTVGTTYACEVKRHF